MRTRSLLVAAAVIGAALIPTASADAATLRVVAGKRTLLSVTQVNAGSTRSYIDTAGRAHRLRANTALGQLVAANAFYNTYIRVGYMSGLGGFVTTIAGIPAPEGGYWALFVNGDMAMLGADSTVIGRDDAVVWLADDDYSSANGPWAYQLSADEHANGTVTFTGIRIGGAKATPAKGAPVLLDGVRIGVLDAKGRLVTRPEGPWTARIAARGRTAASLPISGVGPECRTAGVARVC